MKNTSAQSQNTSALESISGLKNSSRSLPKDFAADQNIEETKTPPASISTDSSLDDILIYARHHLASDVHLSPNNQIFFRIYGSLKAQGADKLTAEKIRTKIHTLLRPEQLSEFTERGDMELVHTIPGAGRYRITLIKQRQGLDVTARIIPSSILTFEQSTMPASCANLTKWAQGLILVTGPASCGKTMSLSVLVEMINQTRHEHIITIENPIEIVYTPKHCQITQRELNKHTLSQANALKASLREDPDIIVVSELRDIESIRLAVTAAETGHLVFGTMNTNNAYQTVFSLINSFPPEEQGVIANMISESLRGVISQHLIPKKDNTGMIPAYEVLLQSTAISAMIREGRIQQINNSIAMGKTAGMVLMDNSLQELVQKGVIDGKEAFYRATTPGTFKQYLNN